MSVLARKLRRDLWHYRGPVGAAALTMAAGIALFVSMRSMHGFLTSAQREYYAAYRFADLFASVRRAPLSVAREVAAIPGVAQLEARIVADVVAEVSGARDLVTARLVSIPDRERFDLNRVHLTRGAYPDPSREPAVIVSAAFAKAHRLTVGDTLAAVINAKRERLLVAGLGQSPEFIYEIRGGGADFLPDARRFGVIWVPHRMLAAAFDLRGGFNDLIVSLHRDAEPRAVIDEIDRLLERWGGQGAYARDDQLSHRFVSDEIEETQVTSIVIPTIFIGVTAFMLYLVTSRLIAAEREQIALLKAFGFSDARVVSHYAQFTLATIAMGTILGLGVGLWLASLLAGVYARFYQFPIAQFRPDPILVLATLGIAGLAALAGGLGSVLAALRLPPAEAMRPPAPPVFRATWVERSRWFEHLTTPARILVRNLIRRPVKGLASIVGIGFGVAIMVVSLYAFDAIDLLKTVGFYEAERGDIRVGFGEAVPATHARAALARIPGVSRVELSRVTPVRLRAGPRSERVGLVGIDQDPELRRIVEPPAHVVTVPEQGLVLTELLADRLGVTRGDWLAIESLEGQRRSDRLPVVATVGELVGFAAYAHRPVVNRLLGESDLVTGAQLALDGSDAAGVERSLRNVPGVSGAAVRAATLQAFDRTIRESFRISLVAILAFACLIAAGVVYNSGRISLSERARELASLRILGFTRGEVAGMLLGEQAVLLLLAIPIGAAVGYGFCWLIAVRFASESFRIPLVLSPTTYLLAAGVVAGAAGLTALVLRQRTNRLDLIGVLKARE